MQKSAQEKTVELFDQKCLIKMNEVATSLLKLAPYDLDTMTCPGLAKYCSVIFPNTDWSQVCREICFLLANVLKTRLSSVNNFEVLFSILILS